jgi:hypothetical protein
VLLLAYDYLRVVAKRLWTGCLAASSDSAWETPFAENSD